MKKESKMDYLMYFNVVSKSENSDNRNMGKCSDKPLTTAPVEAGDFTDVVPEFGRTPDVEKYFGIKRGTLYNLLDQGKIKGAVLRQAGCLKGVRLWHMASVREHILTQMDDSASFAPR